MTIKNIADLDIPDLAAMAERKIIDIINLLDAILHEAKPQNIEAENDIDKIAVLCAKIDEAYDRAKSSLNELQNG